jgi:hypothetical protein
MGVISLHFKQRENAMSEPKTQPTAQTAKAFLAALVHEQRRADCFVLIELMQKATGCKPVMWGTSIIGFGKYKYRYESGREGEWPVIAFSPRKNDLTLYIIPGFENYDELMQKLGKHKTGKSCLYLKRLADIDQKILKELIDASIKAMASKRLE